MKVIDPDLYKTLMDLLAKQYTKPTVSTCDQIADPVVEPKQVAEPENVAEPEQVAEPKQVAEPIVEHPVVQVTNPIVEQIDDALLDFDQLFNHAIKKIKKKAMKRNKKRQPRRK